VAEGKEINHQVVIEMPAEARVVDAEAGSSEAIADIGGTKPATGQHKEDEVEVEVGVKDMEEIMLGQRGRTTSDLAGIGAHSTLEHSKIPQGISDDDLMTETR